MLSFIDRFINGITMYRLTLWGLSLLAALSILFGFFGLISYDGFHLLLSLFLLLITCWISNTLFVRLFNAAPSVESSPITALILFFLIMPVASVKEALILVLTGIVAMASKYLLAIRGRHLFNPAAIGAFFSGFILGNGAIWWVGSSIFLPFVAVVGLLMVRKIHRGTLFLSGVFAAVVTLLVVNLLQETIAFTLVDLSSFITLVFTSWPLVFFASVMLTEPTTTPSTRKRQIIYGILTGILFGLPFSFGRLSMSPELALLLGNIYSSFAEAKSRVKAKLLQRTLVAKDTYHLTFSLPRPLTFIPGQYLEWTLFHNKSDNRGTRRYFTIASSPTEPSLGLGVKMGGKMSTFKQKLFTLQEGEEITVSQLSGDFVLPRDSSEKLVFIAGGIGITPFRSMVQWLIDTQSSRDIVLIYACNTPEDFAYLDVFMRAQSCGVRLVLLAKEAPVGWQGQRGYLTIEMLQKEVPDSTVRHFYISGPGGMVTAYKKLLRKHGISLSRITTDYFPGL
jgi:ferredoxin-NADP reductase/Na+-translocating ferredoxin:NAD+ oxidoreductase RnfD subunit